MTETNDLHRRAQIEHAQGKLKDAQARVDAGEMPAKSYRELRSRIRRAAKRDGIDPDAVAPIPKKPKAAPAAPAAPPPAAGADSVDWTPRPLLLALDSITVDPEIQQRAGGIDDTTAAEYAEALTNEFPAEFPPIHVMQDHALGPLVLADGFHRVEAHRRAGRTEIWALIFGGNRRDALLYAVGANVAHGLRRTHLDKRKAVLTLLDDPEWAQNSDRWIADMARVSPTLVGHLRRLVQAVDTVVRNSTVHVDSGVAEPRPAEAKRPDPKPPAPQVRTGRDGRAISTGKIGKKPKPPAPAPKSPTASEAQAAANHLAGIFSLLTAASRRFTPDEALQICRLIARHLKHLLARCPPEPAQRILAELAADQDDD